MCVFVLFGWDCVCGESSYTQRRRFGILLVGVVGLHVMVGQNSTPKPAIDGERQMRNSSSGEGKGRMGWTANEEQTLGE